MLDAVRAHTSDPPDPDPGRIQPARVLLALADAWPGPLNERHHTDLHALCRQLAVAKRLLNVYLPGWKKPDQPESLPASWWALLIAVLLAYAARADDTDEAARGLALKCLNAALAALDIAQGSNDVAQLPALRAWANDVLQTLSCEVGQ